MASRLDEERGSVKVARNLADTSLPDVVDRSSVGFRDHLLNSTLLACFSGCRSRNVDFTARRSLRLGTQQSSGTWETPSARGRA